MQPLADHWRADARSAQIGSPDGISHSFQVSSYSSEPFTSIRARNLFSKDDWRLALRDERVKSGPHVSFVGMAFSLSSARKRLTRTGACPDTFVTGPSGEAQGERPSSDCGEEMALGIAGEFIWLYIHDTAFVHFAERYLAGLDEFPQPCGGMWIVFIVVVQKIPLTSHCTEPAPRGSVISLFGIT
jgi:hypothetical protein